MDRSLLQHYLETSGMEAAQPRTLAQILGQTVTRDDLLVMDERLRAIQLQLDTRLRSMQLELDSKLSAMQQQLGTGLQATEDRVDARLQAFQHTLQVGLHQVRHEMSEMEKRLLWRFVALLGGFAAVVTALDRLLG